MNRWILILVFGILVFGIVSGADVDDEKVRVLIKIKDVDNEIGRFGTLAAQKTFEKIGVNEKDVNKEVGNYVSVYVDKNDIESLKMNPFVESVGVERIYHTMMQDSVGIINASLAWKLQNAGVNLTGVGQTVCIIDTGVNYSHSGLGGCYGNDNSSSNCTVLGGWDFCGNDGDCAIEDGDPMDVEGHGTHVSGIIASSGSLTGVSPGTKIVMMKAANGTGTFFTINIVSAIDWCVANASKFNISVISMSLGGGRYFNYCDNSDGSNIAIASSINSAIAKNISVVAAAGNDGWTDSISSPACIQNVIPVGAVRKDDSLIYNRNFMVKLFGVGYNINSTCISGNYCLKSGTSMSTPMVAGAIAITNQFLKSTGQTMTPAEIENVLYSTGKNVSELANNYSRINVYSALLSLDNIAPNVSLISPVNNNINLSSNQSFSCNASDWQLANVTFRIWNSSGVYYNGTQNLSGTANGTNFNLINLPKGEYVWNCFVEDALGNLGGASTNFSLTIGEIVVDLNSPVNGSYTNVNVTNFSCVARTDVAYELANMSFRIWNSSGVLIRNESRNISGLENTTNFSYTFLWEGNYLWECVALNNNSDVGDGVNFSISYDSTAPVVVLTSSPSSETSALVSKSFGFNVSEENIANCSLIVNGDVSQINSSVDVSVGQIFSQTFESGSYNWKINCSDLAGNLNFSVESNFVITAPASGGSSSSSISSSSVKVIDVVASEFWKGKSELLGVKDRLNFNLASGTHSLTVKRVGSDFVEIVVESEPLNLILNIGEEKKLNLSGDDYYDLIVRLNSILNGKANVSVMRVFEEVVVGSEDLNGSVPDEVFHIMEEEESKFPLSGNLIIVIGIIILGIILGIIFWITRENKDGGFTRKELRARRKKHKNNLKEVKKKLKRFGLKI